MSLDRQHSVGVYLAVRLSVSLAALVAVSGSWTGLTTAAWTAGEYLLVAAAVPGSELPAFAAARAVTRAAAPESGGR